MHGTEHGTEVQPHAQNIDFTPQSDIKEIVRTGAEQAAGLLIAQNAIASHFYQNPEKLLNLIPFLVLIDGGNTSKKNDPLFYH